MENTKDNKGIFMHQYHGVNCLVADFGKIWKVGEGNWNVKHPDFYLQLKPLSSISDEDAIEVAAKKHLEEL